MPNADLLDRTPTTRSLHRIAIGVGVLFISFAPKRGDLLAQRVQSEAGQPLTARRLIPNAAEATPDLLDAGDLIEVRVFDTPELSGSQRIEADGTITIPGAGKIQVAGTAPSAAASAIESSLRSSGIMLHPKVNVSVTEFVTMGISVLGEVKQPGTYSLLGPQNLYTVLAAAGGPSVNEGSSITITRHADPTHPVVVRLQDRGYNQQLALTHVQAGDVVFVAEAGLIYVVGDVVRPGEFHLHIGQPLRALNAVALAEGMHTTAARSQASIIRTTNSGAETIPVNLDEVAKNKAADPVLEPSDILVIPRSGGKEFLQLALPGVTGAAANAASLALIYH